MEAMVDRIADFHDAIRPLIGTRCGKNLSSAVYGVLRPFGWRHIIRPLSAPLSHLY